MRRRVAHFDLSSFYDLIESNKRDRDQPLFNLISKFCNIYIYCDRNEDIDFEHPIVIQLISRGSMGLVSKKEIDLSANLEFFRPRDILIGPNFEENLREEYGVLTDSAQGKYVRSWCENNYSFRFVSDGTERGAGIITTWKEAAKGGKGWSPASSIILNDPFLFKNEKVYNDDTEKLIYPLFEAIISHNFQGNMHFLIVTKMESNNTWKNKGKLNEKLKKIKRKMVSIRPNMKSLKVGLVAHMEIGNGTFHDRWVLTDNMILTVPTSLTGVDTTSGTAKKDVHGRKEFPFQGILNAQGALPEHEMVTKLLTLSSKVFKNSKEPNVYCFNIGDCDSPLLELHNP